MNRTTFILELTPAGCYFHLRHRYPHERRNAALISLREELLGTAQKVITILPQEKPSCD